MTGKRIRLNRLIEAETSTCLIVAIDHGMTSPRFLPGLFDTGKRVEEAVAGGANVLMLGRGMAKAHAHLSRRDTSLALMLTASAATITPVGSVEEALRAGADAVVVYVALAGENEPEMISFLSRVGETCEFKGMPLIAEAEYPNAYQSLDSMSEALGPEYLKRNARLCAELGADGVKVNWSGDAKSIEEIIRACGKPVVLAGGPDQRSGASDENAPSPEGWRGRLFRGKERLRACSAAGDDGCHQQDLPRWMDGEPSS